MALMNFEKRQKELERQMKKIRESGPMPQPSGYPASKEEFKEIHGRVHDHDKLFKTP